jgi:hypothetical protein
MQKTQVVAALGQRKLMLPSWVKAALSANDRLEVYLTVLQAAASHASHPDREPPDLAKEIAAAGLSNNWLHDVAATARQVNDDLLMPDIPRIANCFVDHLATMARPGPPYAYSAIPDVLKYCQALMGYVRGRVTPNAVVSVTDHCPYLCTSMDCQGVNI